MSDENVQEELERLRAENAALKERSSKALRLQVSAKGGVSLYGIRRFPVTFYVEEWHRILEMGDEIKTYMKEHASEPSGGLEAHYRIPPHYMEDQAPSHARCHAIDAPCWHDGTSLYASEVLIPQWRMRSSEMEVFEFLLSEIDRLAPEEPGVPDAEVSDNPVDVLVALAAASGYALEGEGLDKLREFCEAKIEEDQA